MSNLQVALVAFLVTACDSGSSSSSRALLPPPDGGKCGTGQFLYDDFSCPPPGVVILDAASCEHEGDLLCHERCTSNADCLDPARPYCRILGLFAGYDSNCNVGVRICRERDVDDCPRTPPIIR